MLCSDEHITQLNTEWRGKAEPTDVLSFGMDLDGSEGYPVRVLGDLVISLDTANQQAQERGWVSLTLTLLPSCMYIFKATCAYNHWMTGIVCARSNKQLV